MLHHQSRKCFLWLQFYLRKQNSIRNESLFPVLPLMHPTLQIHELSAAPPVTVHDSLPPSVLTLLGSSCTTFSSALRTSITQAPAQMLSSPWAHLWSSPTPARSSLRRIQNLFLSWRLLPYITIFLEICTPYFFVGNHAIKIQIWRWER